MLKHINVSLVINVITIIGFIIAIIQWRKQSKDARELTRNLTNIEKSLSTRFLHEFPNYHNDIEELINRAEENITLFYDIPAYGLMSNEEGWRRIRNAIDKKISEGVTVDLTIYSEGKILEVLKEQFQHSDENYKKWVSNKSNKEKMVYYVKRNLPDYEGIPSSLNEYASASLKVQDSLLTTVFAGVNTKVRTDELMPIYFWMRDNTEAVISIPAFTTDTSEFGFITSDRNFIEALLKLKDRFK